LRMASLASSTPAAMLSTTSATYSPAPAFNAT